MRNLSIVAGCIALLVAALSHAEIYRYIDDDGNVHYSDKPIGKHSKKMAYPESEDQQPASKTAPPVKQTPESLRELADELEESRLKREENRKTREEARRQKLQEEACEEKREQASQIENEINTYLNQQLNDKEKKGSLELDQRHNTKREQLRDIREYLAANCK